MSPNDTSETITIQITKGYSVVVDRIDEDLSDFKWQAEVDDYTVYARRNLTRVNGKRPSELMHRIIMSRVLGYTLTPNIKVDHRDGNGLNNRRDNLRIASDSENMRNSRRPKNNTSGFKGVSWHKTYKKWYAAIRYNGKSIHLGSFSTPQEAHKAYCDAAVKYHGDFARFE